MALSLLTLMVGLPYDELLIRERLELARVLVQGLPYPLLLLLALRHHQSSVRNVCSEFLRPRASQIFEMVLLFFWGLGIDVF